jgi:hypothetical protein
MLNLYSDANERLDLKVCRNLASEFRPELFAMLRPLHLVHLVEELWAPLCAAGPTVSAVALEERPWPPTGVGSRRLRGFCTALLVDGRQAILTPQLLAADQQSNIGLAAALTRLLFGQLAEQGIREVGLWINASSSFVSSLLRRAGFAPGEMRVVSEGCEFVLYTASADTVLNELRIAEARLGDLLALSLDAATIATIAGYHLGLQAGIGAYWADHVAQTEIYPGLIDWAALPPGGIGGTPGPPLPDTEQPIFGS